MPDEIEEHDQQFIKDILSQLRRHYPTAQVFITREEPGGETLAYSTGYGNWYARFGQVTEWLNNGGAMRLIEPSEEGEA